MRSPCRSFTALFACLVAAGLATQPARAESRPGRLKILGLSLLLPGLGHRALGEDARSTPFFVAEAGVWTAYGVFQTQGHLRKDSYVEMAEIFAGIDDADGRSGEYYRNVGTYRTSDDYDDEVRRDARARHGDDLAAREAYFQAHRVPDPQRWEWTSRAQWARYREKRSDANQSFKRADYMIGFAVANRLVAAIDAMLLVHRRSQETSWNLHLEGDPFDPQEPARLRFAYSFR